MYLQIAPESIKETTPNWLIIKICKYYLSYLSGGNEYLQKAYNLVKKAHIKYPANITFLFYTIFFNIEIGDKKTAIEMLSDFKSYIPYYKNDNDILAYYYFLQGIADSNNIKKSESIIIALEKDKYCHLLCFMYVKTNPRYAYTFLDKAFSEGNRSPFLYLCFSEMFKNGRRYYRSGIMVSYLRWSIYHNILTEEELQINFHLFKDIFPKNIELFIEIHKKLNLVWLLKEICELLSQTKNYTFQSYNLYKELICKQIFEPSINTSLLYSAYKNGIEDISRFSIQKFIISQESKDNRILFPYVFYLILTKPNFYELIEDYNLKDEIIVTSLNVASKLSKEETNKYYNALFCYVLKNMQNYNGNAKSLVNIMEQSVLNNLFTYVINVSDTQVKYIWISESTKSLPIYYEVNNYKATINLVSKDFKILFLKDDKSTIIEEDFTIERQIQGDFFLYNYFYRKNQVNANIIIAITEYYISENILTSESYEVLNRAVTINGLSVLFKLKITQFIGNILFIQSNSKKVLDYYKKINVNAVDDKYIETIFNVLVENSEDDLAISLISTRSQSIKENTLFKFINDVLKKQKRVNPLIINAIYELIIKGYYKEDFLKILLQHYKGSLLEWCNLSNALAEHYINNLEIDTKILQDAIICGNLSTEVCQVFLRLYYFKNNLEVIHSFIYYACYQVLRKNNKLNEDVVQVLKQVYNKVGDSLLLLTIATCDINDKSIINSVLKCFVSENIFLPIFMNIEDNYFCASYVACSNKNVMFYYKVNGSEAYKKLPTRYFQFGIWVVFFPIFYNEVVEYYFEEELEENKPQILTYTNDRVSLVTNRLNKYNVINNSIIYYEMFKYNDMEKYLDSLLKPKENLCFKLV